MTLPIISNFRHGFNTYLKGLRWLKKKPFYAFVLFIPIITACLIVILGWGLFLSYQETIFEWFLIPKPDTFLMTLLHYLLRVFAYIVSFVAGLILCLLVNNIAASPIYDWVSQKVEEDLLGRKSEPMSLWQSFLLIGEEIKKACFVIIAWLIILLVPGLNLLAPLATAFFLGWEFYDYPLARKSWSFKRRLVFTLQNFWSITGFGVWLCLPFLQIFLMPLAVVGGTMLATKNLENKSH